MSCAALVLFGVLLSSSDPPLEVDSLEDLGIDFDFQEETRLQNRAHSNERAFEAAGVVHVLDDKDIQALPVRDLVELLAYIPSMFVTYEAYGFPLVGIRYPVSQNATPYQIYIDGVAQTLLLLGSTVWALRDMDLATIARIEIAVGGSTAIHGTNAGVGVISIWTKDAVIGTSKNSAAIDYGNRNHLVAAARYQTPYNGKYGFWASAQIRHHDGFPKIEAMRGNPLRNGQRNRFAGSAGPLDTSALSLKYQYENNGWQLSLGALGSFGRSRRHRVFGSRFDPNQDEIVRGDDHYYHANAWSGAAWKGDAVSFDSLLTFHYEDLEFQSNGAPGAATVTQSTGMAATTWAPTDFVSFAAEFQTLVLNNKTRTIRSPRGFALASWTADPGLAGLFSGLAAVNLTPRGGWSLGASLRAEKWVGGATNKSFSPGVRLRWAAPFDLTVWASWSRNVSILALGSAFVEILNREVGSGVWLGSLPLASSNQAQVNVLQNWEVGLRCKVFDLLWDLNAYYIQSPAYAGINDRKISTASSIGNENTQVIGGVFGAGPLKSLGGEAKVIFNPHEAFNAEASLSLTRMSVTYPDGSEYFPLGRANYPSMIFRLRATWEVRSNLMLSIATIAHDRFTGVTRYFDVSRQQQSSVNNAVLKAGEAHLRLDFKIRTLWLDGRLEISLWGRDLLASDYTPFYWPYGNSTVPNSFSRLVGTTAQWNF